MFGQRWRNFRRDVEAHIGLLTGADAREEPLRGMLARFEDLEPTLKREFEHGCTSVQTAVSVCAQMLAAELEQCPDLWPQARGIEHRLVERDAPPACRFETQMRRFLEQAEVLLERGLIDDRLFTFASSEILGTLEGLDPQARSANRVTSLFAGESAAGASAA